MSEVTIPEMELTVNNIAFKVNEQCQKGYVLTEAWHDMPNRQWVLFFESLLEKFPTQENSK